MLLHKAIKNIKNLEKQKCSTKRTHLIKSQIIWQTAESVFDKMMCWKIRNKDSDKWNCVETNSAWQWLHCLKWNTLHDIASSIGKMVWMTFEDYFFIVRIPSVVI